MVSSDRLEPGATGQIRASVDTTGRIGRLEKHIAVYSNDAETPVVTLSLSAEVVEQ